MKRLGVTYSPFNIVVVPFPFADRATTKKRPALVISTNTFNSSHNQLILAMITTAHQSKWSSDIFIQDWTDAGLSTSCYVRLKLFTLDQGLIIRRIGSLSRKDKTAVQTNLEKFMSFRQGAEEPC